MMKKSSKMVNWKSYLLDMKINWDNGDNEENKHDKKMNEIQKNKIEYR